MKKLLLFVVLGCIKLSCVAQDSKVVFGLKTGINASILSASFNSDPSSRIGFHLGFYIKTPISEKVSFRPEIYYSAEGQKDDYGSGSKTTTKMDFLNVPLLFEVGRRVSFQFGPQFGFLLSAAEEGTIDGDKINEDLKDYMKSMNVSLVLGIGVSPGDNFNLGLRYNLGMTDMFDVATPDFPTVKTRVMHVYIAYSF